jgi:hypothetical protein
MSTEHARIEELISALQDGAASPAEQALVERHIATCPSCRATVAAFRRNDERLRRYLQATPVPPIGSPWLTAAGARSAERGARNWRVALAGLVTVLVLALGAAWYMQRQAGTADRQAASQAPEVAIKPAATVAADQANRSAGAPFAGATTAPTAAAAAGGPTPAAAVAPAPASGGAAATTAPAQAAGSPAAGAAAPTRAASAAAAASPAAAPARPATINPAQRYGLTGATALTLCWPACEAQPRPPELRDAVVRALDRDLAVVGPPPTPTPAVGAPPSPEDYVALTFSLPDGRLVGLVYYRRANLLQLPNNDGWLLAPQELAAALVGVAPAP